jgi:5-methylcytosine-specific restriction protein A
MMNALKLFRGFAKFNRTANYKQIFANNLKKEKAKVTKQRKDEATRNSIDNSVPEAENTIRPEGTVSQVCVTHYERNSEGRRRALEKYGYTCQVCGMNFEDVYGEIGHQYIEVHHLYPVCNMGENYQFDPLDEERGLVPLCSNCHSMIHRGGKIIVQNGEKVMVPMPLQALRDRIKVKKQI